MITPALMLLASAGTVQRWTMINSGYIMRKNIDSIVQPGKYTSHMHSFFGNDAVNATTSTTDELLSGCATNSNPNDLSVYWHPTLYANNGTDLVPIEARYFKAYYNSIDTAEIPFPADFKAVAGNASATSAADVDELWNMSWWCEYGPETSPDANGWPDASCNIGRLQTQLLFPDCVNPETLASDYSSRAWLANSNRCPDGMKRIPQLRFSVRFDTSAALPDGWEGEAPLQLASGNSYSFHGDFVNGWLPEAAENMMLASDKGEFQDVPGPRSEVMECTPVDVDPDHGTSDYEESLVLMAAAKDEDENEDHVLQESATAVPSTPVASSSIGAIPSMSKVQPSPSSSYVRASSEPVTVETPVGTQSLGSGMPGETELPARPRPWGHRNGRWSGHGHGHGHPRS
ncbi:hypothetical protein FE257_006531 [Aspergillus nanangensis]|uniref:DUF1996 domain-containing protein n=1 Tax=Aspergillus nanangensis TaxID=2582783 RepID=A0AAD4H0F1_ASPNN|nr:hypothetical protein FE257_006531 [Aspergillus nanangensis]